MLSNSKNINFYARKVNPPVIISPKTDEHWFSDRDITLVWKYSGYDRQNEYNIQVLKTNYVDIDSSLSEDELWANSYEIDEISLVNTISIVLPLVDFPQDGIFRWRIRTKGSIATTWTDWADNGFVRIDGVSPSIKNISIETPCGDITVDPKVKLASVISDLSSPMISTARTALITDLGIERAGYNGLYISYDYRDCSIILRCQSGSSSTKKRYYGLMSFHSDYSSIDPDFSIQDAVKYAYLYKINKDETKGPYHETLVLESVLSNSGKYFVSKLEDLLYSTDYVNNDDMENPVFIPKGFPKFWNHDIFYSGESVVSPNFPATFSADAYSYLSVFPFNTRYVSNSREYLFPDGTTNTFHDFVELRYPAPFHDVCLILSPNLDKIYAFGVIDPDQLELLENEPETAETIILTTGCDVFANIVAGERDTASLNIFDSEPLVSRTLGFTSGGSKYPSLPFSNYLFFNLVPDADDNDMGLKIYLNKFAKRSYEENVDKTEISYVEFHMRPDADCSLAYQGDEKSAYQSQILMNEIYIGRSKITPKSLSMYDLDLSDSQNRKEYFKSIKVPVETIAAEAWGSGDYFQSHTLNDEDKPEYNGSFRIKLPEYAYIPYYHPNAVDYVNSSLSKPALPHIIELDPNSSINEPVDWDYIELETSNLNIVDSLVKYDFLNKSDFIRFEGDNTVFGNINPFLYNLVNLETDNIDRGTISRIRTIGNLFDYSSASSLAFTMCDSGWSPDLVWYNQIDSGLYGINEIENVNNTRLRLRLKDFSNYLFRKALRVKISENALEDDLAYDEITTSVIRPERSDDNTTYIWGVNNYNILQRDINDGGTANGPLWALYADSEVIGENFDLVNAILGDDNSSQGYFGINGDADSGWMGNQSNMFGGYYLIAENSDDEIVFDKVSRLIISQSEENESLIIRSQFRSLLDIQKIDSAYLSGDIFSIGNIFTYVYPRTINGGKYIRLFFDINEATSGIKYIKTFIVDLDINANGIESSQYAGLLDSGGDLSKMRIKMQPLNNSDSEVNIRTMRSSNSLIESYFNENSRLKNYWVLVDTVAVETVDDNDAGYGLGRFYHDLKIENTTGYKLVYIQVKDKGGNVSGIYCLPFSVQEENVISEDHSVDNIFVSVDDQVATETSTLAVGSVDYVFESRLVPRDQDSFRTISLTRPLTYDGSSYAIHSRPESILAGFSDNYGLGYNVYSPFTSTKSWRFDRPIAIRIKGFDKLDRGADWFFDPNDIRHYTSDTDYDYLYGIGNTNNNRAGTVHIPGNATGTSITLIGLRSDEITGDSSTWGKTNPLAEKIFENKEELIGKKLYMGANLSVSFTILHIFKTNYLPAIKRFTSGGSLESTIDGDNQMKVWIVVEDSDAICALILSRKLQYFTASNVLSDDARTNLGYRSSLTVSYPAIGSQVINFGYYASESLIPTSVNDFVNTALNMSGDSDEVYPTHIAGNNNELYFYISPCEVINTPSDLSTEEGWVVQYFQGYKADNLGDSVGSSILNSYNSQHHQLLGLGVVNRLVFGQSLNVDGVIESFSSANNLIILGDSRFDSSFIGLTYSILDEAGGSIATGSILDISAHSEIAGVIDLGDNGKVVQIDQDISSLMSVGEEYTIMVVISPLQTVNSATGLNYNGDWWPDVGGSLIPPYSMRLGSIGNTDEDYKENVKFSVVSQGAFYIPVSGYYSFKIDIDNYGYADFAVDYLDVQNLVKDRFEVYDAGGVLSFEERYVGGFFRDEDVSKTFYLRSGWHTGRFRYISKYGPTDDFPAYAVIWYSKPDWPDDVYVPFMGSDNDNYSFMARSFRSVYCRLLSDRFDQYPKFIMANPVSDIAIYSPDYTKASRVCRAVVGFFDSFKTQYTNRYENQVVKIGHRDDEGEVGHVDKKTVDNKNLTFGAQVVEEIFGTYESNIIDGGRDFRFWKIISWSPVDQPGNTGIKFYIRTGETEEELLLKTWNNVGTEDDPDIREAFTVSGSNILEFSQQPLSTSSDPIVYRYLQFKMVLSSRSNGITPVVDEVVIQYSKLNSVNFFTTTFNLTSNIVRAILSYNGDIPVDPSGVSLADIQFGISTVEETEGIVSNNFDDYAIIPTNEAFTLADLGIKAAENDKFRIGIRFISSEGALPYVDDFGVCFEQSDSKITRNNSLT